MSKTTREQAMLIAAEKQRIRILQERDIGAYAKSVGVLARYLVGGQWKPSRKHGKRGVS